MPVAVAAVSAHDLRDARVAARRVDRAGCGLRNDLSPMVESPHAG
jgi:hypothetical protein